jgi:hypothetical protein
MTHLHWGPFSEENLAEKASTGRSSNNDRRENKKHGGGSRGNVAGAAALQEEGPVKLPVRADASVLSSLCQVITLQ